MTWYIECSLLVNWKILCEWMPLTNVWWWQVLKCHLSSLAACYFGVLVVYQTTAIATTAMENCNDSIARNDIFAMWYLNAYGRFLSQFYNNLLSIALNEMLCVHISGFHTSSFPDCQSSQKQSHNFI